MIALLAASFGIVNTLLMSVQERTREIGLMKAMGMGSGKVFGLFSLEAVFIGFLGSAIGAGIGILAGSAISRRSPGTLLADLPGLTLIAFDPVSIAMIIARRDGRRVPRGHTARRARGESRPGGVAALRVTRHVGRGSNGFPRPTSCHAAELRTGNPTRVSAAGTSTRGSVG